MNSCCTEAENVSTPTPSFSNHRFCVSCSYFLLIGKVSGPHMYWTILRTGAYVYFYSNPSGFQSQSAHLFALFTSLVLYNAGFA